MSDRDINGSLMYPSKFEKYKPTTTSFQGRSSRVVRITDSSKQSSIPFKSQGPHWLKLGRINPVRLKHMTKICQKLTGRTFDSNT